MKTVGIILREWEASYHNRLLYAVSRDLIRFLKRYENINLICIPVDNEEENEFQKIKEAIDMCDGIVAPGGLEIKKVDIEMVKYLYDIDKPTLGICLGMQIMGVVCGGKLLEYAVGEKHNTEERYVHDIIIDKESRLYEILQEQRIKVNSRHHDCIENANIDCVAKSEDNILEAIEDKNKKFFIGVQWHPESLYDDIYSKRLFDSFMKKL